MKLTVPQWEILGAAGDLISSVNNPDGTKTLTYHSEDVHDFSWAASPHFTDIEDSWTGSAGTVKIHLLMSPGHLATAPRYLRTLKNTMELFDEWYGPYPYDRITVVDPPHGGSEAGAMEYPTLFTADTTLALPKGALIPEDTLEHEFGHQYWYGMVATNEFEEPWLDEGIDNYTEVKVMEALYGRDTSFFNFPFAQMGSAGEERTHYLSLPDTDPLTRVGWQFLNDRSYGSILYGKAAAALLTLEKIIGEDVLRRALRTYFMRYRFTHPTGEDFLKTVEEVSGQDLLWYFNQVVSGTAILDYEVSDAWSETENWDEETPESNAAKGTRYRTVVVLRRKGDFLFPVDLEVRFDNGETIREQWDGRDRWMRFEYVKPARVVSAEIDAEHRVWLDCNFFNNSRTARRDTRATLKLANLWGFFSECFAQFLSWLS